LPTDWKGAVEATIEALLFEALLFWRFDMEGAKIIADLLQHLLSNAHEKQ
jgi:hypothetical protein